MKVKTMSSAAPAEPHVSTGSDAASRSAARTHAATQQILAENKSALAEQKRLIQAGRLVYSTPYSTPVPHDPDLERRMKWEADPATRFNPTPPLSTCVCIMCQLRSPRDLPMMCAFAGKTFAQRCGLQRTALLNACALGHKTMAAMLVAHTTTAGALDAVGRDGCSALCWAEERGMHCVAQSLRESGATAGRWPALALCRGEAGAVEVDVKGQTVAFTGSSATLRSAKRCLPRERKYLEIEVLAIERTSRLRCGVATASLGSMFSASDTGLGDDNQSWAVNGLSQKAIHNAKQRTASAPHGKEVTSSASRATSSCRSNCV